MPKIEEWSVTGSSFHGPFKSPDLPEISPQDATSGRPTFHLFGQIVDHPSPRFPNWTEVRTSAIVAKSGENVVTYSGSSYELGEVNPVYERQFPEARARLLRSLEDREEVGL